MNTENEDNEPSPPFNAWKNDDELANEAYREERDLTTPQAADAVKEGK